MKHVVLLVLGLLLAPSPARAEVFDDAERVAREVANAAIYRVRRSIVIGPEASYFAGSTTDGEVHAGLAFGLALYVFQMPSIKEQLLAARARVTERLLELVRSGRISDLKHIPQEILDEVRREVAGELQARVLETPRLKLVLEGGVLHAPDGIQARAIIGYGIGPITFGVHAGVQELDDQKMLVGGPELSLHLTPIGKKRTPVIDLFVRNDIGIDEGIEMISFVGGARLTLDLL